MYRRVVGWQEPTDYYILSDQDCRGLIRCLGYYGHLQLHMLTPLAVGWDRELSLPVSSCESAWRSSFQASRHNKLELRYIKSYNRSKWRWFFFLFKMIRRPSQLWTTFTVEPKMVFIIILNTWSNLIVNVPFWYSFFDDKPCHIPALIYVGVCIRLVFD